MAEEQNQNQPTPQQEQDQVNGSAEERKEQNPSRLTQDDINAFLQNEEARTAPQDILMQWEAPEFKQVQRPQQWYIFFAVIGILFVVYAIFTANYLFALIVVILAIVLNQFFHKKPETINVALTREGVAIDNDFYPYASDLTSFWILYSPPDVKKLTLERGSSVQPNLTIELEEQNPLKIREILLNYLPEDVEQEESQIDATFRRWGF